VVTGAVCDDANPCTGTDICDGGGACSGTPIAGRPCDDGSLCTEADVCTTVGTCGGFPLDCDDGDPCTFDGCDPLGGCFNDLVSPGTPCDDGVACTLSACDEEGACVAGQPAPLGTSCVGDDPCRVGDRCDEPCRLDDSCDSIGFCTPGATPAAAGTICDDGRDCTVGDGCDGQGLCSGNAQPAGTACDDGNSCSGPDVCDEAGTCHAPEICDGLDNDCDGQIPGDEADVDADGLAICAGDCDDTNNLCGVDCTDGDGDGACAEFDCDDSDPAVRPGLIESNDGKDNNCNGECDENSGVSGFDPVNQDDYVWAAQPGATTTQATVSTSSQFSAGSCVGGTSTTTGRFRFSRIPNPGQLFFFVNRPILPILGSFGSGRDQACGSESDCFDGIDNENDGLTDSDDPDCSSQQVCE
jgi:hypothetical protein